MGDYATALGRIGVWIDNVLDVVYLHPGDIAAIPSAIKSSPKEFVNGTAPYGGKMLSVLDLQKIFKGESLTVDEML